MTHSGEVTLAWINERYPVAIANDIEIGLFYEDHITEVHTLLQPLSNDFKQRWNDDVAGSLNMVGKWIRYELVQIRNTNRFQINMTSSKDYPELEEFKDIPFYRFWNGLTTDDADDLISTLRNPILYPPPPPPPPEEIPVQHGPHLPPITDDEWDAMVRAANREWRKKHGVGGKRRSKNRKIKTMRLKCRTRRSESRSATKRKHCK
jgi:hypothetical protein